MNDSSSASLPLSINSLTASLGANLSGIIQCSSRSHGYVIIRSLLSTDACNVIQLWMRLSLHPQLDILLLASSFRRCRCHSLNDWSGVWSTSTLRSNSIDTKWVPAYRAIQTLHSISLPHISTAQALKDAFHVTRPKHKTPLHLRKGNISSLQQRYVLPTLPLPWSAAHPSLRVEDDIETHYTPQITSSQRLALWMQHIFESISRIAIVRN